MSEYPIEGLMNTAMNSIKEMVDVNTIIGDPIETSNNVVIIPVSKVNFGFAAGGSEFRGKTSDETKNKDEKEEKPRLPFGGGSGAGVSISPIAFIVVQETGVKLLPVEHGSSLDKLIDLVPDLIDKVNQMIEKQAKRIESCNESNFKYEKKQNKENKDSDEPSKPVKVESKPYDIEYDETDM